MVEEEKVQTHAWYNSSLEYLQDRLFLNAQLSLTSALGEVPTNSHSFMKLIFPGQVSIISWQIKILNYFHLE